MRPVKAIAVGVSNWTAGTDQPNLVDSNEAVQGSESRCQYTRGVCSSMCIGHFQRCYWRSRWSLVLAVLRHSSSTPSTKHLKHRTASSHLNPKTSIPSVAVVTWAFETECIMTRCCCCWSNSWHHSSDQYILVTDRPYPSETSCNVQLYLKILLKTSHCAQAVSDCRHGRHKHKNCSLRHALHAAASNDAVSCCCQSLLPAAAGGVHQQHWVL